MRDMSPQKNQNPQADSSVPYILLLDTCIHGHMGQSIHEWTKQKTAFKKFEVIWSAWIKLCKHVNLSFYNFTENILLYLSSIIPVLPNLQVQLLKTYKLRSQFAKEVGKYLRFYEGIFLVFYLLWKQCFFMHKRLGTFFHFFRFQESLKSLRLVDDKIIYKLNVSVPTESFKHEIDAEEKCRTLYQQV